MRFLLAALGATFLVVQATAQYGVTVLNPSGATFSRAWNSYAGKQVGDAGAAPIQTAALWSGTSASAVPLTPPGWSRTAAFGIYGNQQVGVGNSSGTSFQFHALMWAGTAASAIDLNPAGYAVSAAYGTDGTTQSGQATTNGGEIHAMAWKGSAASAVDLHPAGYTASRSYAAWNGTQVGEAELGGIAHAALWTGTSGSFLDLNGSLDSSTVNAAFGGYQVGTGSGATTGGANHAMKWSGSAGSMVDLNSTGLIESYGWGIGGNTVAGYGSGSLTNNKLHALAWVGNSVIDLHTYLPSSYGTSYAYGVDPVTGQIVGEAINNLNRHVAVMWTPVPEPATLSVFGIGILLLRRRRR